MSSTAPLSKPNKFKLSGNEEQFDFDWNVYDFNARTYDPILGRFMQVDPLSDLMNGETPYHYVFNNPLILKDPSGLFPTDLGSGGFGSEGSWWEQYKDSFDGSNICQCLRAGAPDNDYNVDSKTGETTVTKTDDDYDRVLVDGREVRRFAKKASGANFSISVSEGQVDIQAGPGMIDLPFSNPLDLEGTANILGAANITATGLAPTFQGAGASAARSYPGRTVP